MYDQSALMLFPKQLICLPTCVNKCQAPVPTHKTPKPFPIKVCTLCANCQACLHEERGIIDICLHREA